MLRFIATFAILCLDVTGAFGQTPAPSFEVATIKPCAQQGSGGRGAIPAQGAPAPPAGRWTSRCQTVAALITTAYVRFADGRRNDPQFVPLSGGPSWIRSDGYIIDAKA